VNERTSQAAAGANVERSPRQAIEQWLADTGGDSFSVADYGHLFTEIAAVEPNRVIASKLERARRSLDHIPGRKRMDAVIYITRIVRMIEKGTPRSVAILMVAKERARPSERLESVAKRLRDSLEKYEDETTAYELNSSRSEPG
jgi:hypothetical protein